MANLFSKPTSLNPGRLIRSIIFFILFYLWLWLKVDLRLIYHGGGAITTFPVFYRGWAFFQQFIWYPGGPVEYLSAFLSQFFCIGWAGALVATLHAWLICICTDYFFKVLNAPRLRWVRFIPPVLLLITYTQYTYYFVTTTAFLAALVFVNLYLWATTEGKPSGFFIFPVLSVALYYLADGAYLLFAILCAVYELFFKYRWQMGLLCLLSVFVVPYIEGVLIFDVNIVDSFTELLPLSFKTITHEAIKIVYILYMFIPLTAFVYIFWQKFIDIAGLSPKQPNTNQAKSPEVNSKAKEEQQSKFLLLLSKAFAWYTNTSMLRWFSESCLLFVLACSAVFLFQDDNRKTLFEVDYYACHKMWPEVIAAAQRGSANDFVVHAVNRALYHSGQLGVDMFLYPQNPYALLLSGDRHGNWKAHWKRVDVCIDLGFMNKAESDLTEALQIFGERGEIIKRLALINMVKGNLDTARIYLGALNKTIFYADWANDYLDRINTDPNLLTDKEIQRLRHLMVEKDNDDAYSALWKKSKLDRMAFEYLMAFYMMTGQLADLVRNINQLDDFGYREIPRLYEEAILLYSSETKRKVNLNGRQISSQSIQRFNNFNQMFELYKQDRQQVLSKLEKEYGDTYFFHYMVGPFQAKK